MAISLDIFKPDEKRIKIPLSFEQKVFWTSLIILILSLTSCVLFDKEFVNQSLRIPTITIVCICMPTMLIIQISAIYKFEPLRGKLNGKITLTDNEITIREISYKIDSIEQLSLNIKHFKSQFQVNASSIALPNPTRSNGSGNFIFFKNGSQIIHEQFIVPSEETFTALEQLNSKWNELEYK